MGVVIWGAGPACPWALPVCEMSETRVFGRGLAVAGCVKVVAEPSGCGQRGGGGARRLCGSMRGLAC